MYLNFYDLKNEPFHITPDPEFLFLSPSHKEALGSIIYGIEKRKGFVSIVGEVGTGKTTIVRSYLERFAQEQIRPIYFFNVNISFAELLKTIFQELGVIPEAEDVYSMIRQLHQVLIKAYRQNHIIVLIIDEAHNMPVETLEKLRMLSNLETRKEKLLQIVLVGQPELQRKLNSSDLRQLRQRLAIRANLYPLSQRESRDYIHHRLSLVTKDSKAVFTPRAIKRIVKHADGIPRVLNILCDNSLIAGFGYQKKPVTMKIVKEAIDDYEGGKSPRSLTWKMVPVAGLLVLIGILMNPTYSDMLLSKLNFLNSMRNTYTNFAITVMSETGQKQPSPPGRNQEKDQLPVEHFQIADANVRSGIPEAEVSSKKGESSEAESELPPPSPSSDATSTVNQSISDRSVNMDKTVNAEKALAVRTEIAESKVPPTTAVPTETLKSSQTALLSQNIATANVPAEDEMTDSAESSRTASEDNSAVLEPVSRFEDVTSSGEESLVQRSFPSNDNELQAEAIVVKPIKPFPVIRVVQKGDYLTKLCYDIYGFTNDRLIQHIKANNAQIADADLIRVGERILFPEPDMDLKKEKTGLNP